MPINATPNAGLSLSLRNQYGKHQRGIGQAIERLSTGKRINRPSDDPSGFIAAEQIRGELTDVTAELKTYDLRRLSLRHQGSQLATFQSRLNEIKGQVVEATGDQIGQDKKAALQQQVEAAFEAFDYISSGYDSSVLSSSGSGSSAPDSSVPGNDLNELATGEPANLVDGDTALADEIIEEEISNVAIEQARVGIELQQADRFEELARDKEVILTETLSQIEDADFAVETSNLAISQTLTQAATAALAYSQQTHSDTIGELLDRIDTPGNERPVA